MQLAITTRTWSGLIFYTSKGMVIDRVIFDENHWKNLRENILNFYFDYMLDEISLKIKTVYLTEIFVNLLKIREIKCSRKTCFSPLVKLNVRKSFFTIRISFYKEHLYKELRLKIAEKIRNC